MPVKNEKPYNEPEKTRRFLATLRGALSTPPKPIKKRKPEKPKAKKPKAKRSS